jgi:hypothetical protein
MLYNETYLNRIGGSVYRSVGPKVVLFIDQLVLRWFKKYQLDN